MAKIYKWQEMVDLTPRHNKQNGMDAAERDFWESVRDHARFVRRRKHVAFSAATAAMALEQEIEQRLELDEKPALQVAESTIGEASR